MKLKDKINGVALFTAIVSVLTTAIIFWLPVAPPEVIAQMNLPITLIVSGIISYLNMNKPVNLGSENEGKPFLIIAFMGIMTGIIVFLFASLFTMIPEQFPTFFAYMITPIL